MLKILFLGFFGENQVVAGDANKYKYLANRNYRIVGNSYYALFSKVKFGLVHVIWLDAQLTAFDAAAYTSCYLCFLVVCIFKIS